MFDIDVQKAGGKGTTQGAEELGKYLQTIFPNLYLEPSTGGQGLHGYFLFETEGGGPEYVRMQFSILDQRLKNHVAHFGYDVENIEIKGTPPQLKWNRWIKGQVDDVYCGLLAKLPRGLLDRFDELKNTTTINARFIGRLQVYELTAEKTKVKQKQKRSGSTYKPVWHKTETTQFQSFVRVAGTYLQELEGIHELRITAEDKAVALMILLKNKKNPEENFSFSQSYARAMWRCLFEMGITTRAWNHHRWRLIRNFLADQGWIECKDASYCFYTTEDEGKDRKKGFSCKFVLDDHMAKWLEQEVACCSEKEVIEDHITWEGISNSEQSKSLPQGSQDSFRPKLVYADEIRYLERLFYQQFAA